MQDETECPDLGILPQVFSQYSDIQAVYLFGSFASGKVHGESDLDNVIGVMGGSNSHV